MKKKTKNAIQFLTFTVLALLMILELDRAFSYRDRSIWSTDSRVRAYKELPENSIDVLFLGSSNIMSGIDPIQLWEKTGLQSYNYCSRAQTFAFSYAYLQDALKTQSPRCVVLDTYSVLSDKVCNGLSDKDFHFGVNMDNLSLNSKMELLRTYVQREEQLMYLFPLLKNHNYYQTWENVTDETDQIFMGFCSADAVEPYEAPVYSDAVRPMEETDRIYLEKIIELCRQEGIDLFLIRTPVVCSDDRHSMLNDVWRLCREYDVDFYDMTGDALEWGFDYGSDMMDDTHVNKSGAVKVTNRLGNILADRYGTASEETREFQWLWELEAERMALWEEEQ